MENKFPKNRILLFVGKLRASNKLRASKTLRASETLLATADLANGSAGFILSAKAVTATKEKIQNK